MMMSEKNIRHIIRQILLAESESDEKALANMTADEPLGRYAFSPQRQGPPAPLPRPPQEPNTDFEQKLFWSLYMHFSDPESSQSFTKNSEYANIVSDFLKKGKYSDVFKEPEEDVVYRGVLLSIDTLRKMLPPNLFSDVETLEAKDSFEIETTEDLRKIAERYDTNTVITNKDNRPVSSWTISAKIATEFANRGYWSMPAGSKHLYNVILCASPADNRYKFLDAKSLYGIGGIGGIYTREQEVISIGSIKLDHMYIVRIT